MRRALFGLVAGLLVLAGLFGLVAGSFGGLDPAVYDGVAILLVLFALGGALWKVAGDVDDDTAPPPWGDDDFSDGVPERTPDVGALSGESFAGVIARAGETAREDGTVAAGVAVVRSPLRETLLQALAAGGVEGERAERAVDSGRWTGDPVAAAVLSPSIDPPSRSLGQRVEAWLFPERTVRRETTRAVAAVSRAADEVLPVLPGRNAPRSVPVVEPSIADLRRGADDELRLAADPLAADRGGDPVDPSSDADEADAGTADDAPDGDGSIEDEGATAEADSPDGSRAGAAADGNDSTGFAPTAGSPFAGVDGDSDAGRSSQRTEDEGAGSGGAEDEGGDA